MSPFVAYILGIASPFVLIAPFVIIALHRSNRQLRGLPVMPMDQLMGAIFGAFILFMILGTIFYGVWYEVDRG